MPRSALGADCDNPGCPTRVPRAEKGFCPSISQSLEKLSKPKVLLNARGIVTERQPERCMIKLRELFIVRRSLVAVRFGVVKEAKLLEVLDELRTLFAASELRPEDSPREREGPEV